METQSRLDELRKRIDEIDDQLMPLFNERMKVVHAVGALKGQTGQSVTDVAREQQVVKKALAHVEEDLHGEAAMFMRTAIALSREYQNRLLLPSEPPWLSAFNPPSDKPAGSGQPARLVCAYQGLPQSLGERTAARLFDQPTLVPLETVQAVFAAVIGRQADFGLVPIEDTRLGVISETLGLLHISDCFIVRRATVVDDISGQDMQTSRASFVVVGRQAEALAESRLVAISFILPDKAGALCEALLPIAAAVLNMRSLSVRPDGEGGCGCFIELEGNIADKNVVTALQQVAAVSRQFKVLGCYGEAVWDGPLEGMTKGFCE